MIKVVSFDIGGTLIKNEEIIEKGLDLKSLSILLKLPYEDVRNTYKNIFQKTKGNFDELVSDFCKTLSIPVDKKVVDFFKKKFVNTGEKQIEKANIELIKEIKKQGYKVILFSNNCCLLENNINNKLNNFVDGIFYSYNLGYTKSDKESYKYIETQLNNMPEEFLHIGDTLISDYYEPIKNGWKAIYYGSTEDKTIESITNLNEILDVLKKISK